MAHSNTAPSRARMKLTTAVADDFFKNAFNVRAFALAHDFNVAPEFQGHRYKGCVPVADPKLLSELEAGLAKIHGAPCKVTLAFFRLSLHNEDTPVWIHPDSSCDEMAAVVYLTRPLYCYGGTAFWKHRGLGLDYYPDMADCELNSIVPGQWLAEQVNQDGQSSDAWEMTGLVSMKFNRLVTYPTKLFHSRYPKESFGNNQDDGRLILAAFYSINDKADSGVGSSETTTSGEGFLQGGDPSSIIG